jgi:Xaa-Pro aminopeptidase
VNAERRLAAFRRRLTDEDFGAALVMDLENMRYLTGFENVFDVGINAACLITSEFARFYTDSRYSEAATQAAEGTPWIVRVQKESLYVEMSAELKAEGVGSLALESQVPYGRFKFISQQFAGRIAVIDQWAEELRQIKEPREIEAIERAAALADQAFAHVLGIIKPGLREIDVALELESFMRSRGSDGLAFDTIAASGPNAARPHAKTTDRQLREGEMLKLDFGARIDGYCCDITRTVAIGEADERLREVYAAVLEANETALAVVRSGLKACDVDAAARDVLKKRGLAEQFTHGLGHGVGLAVHELPTLNARNSDPLRAGSVVTIEPGVYVPGWGGVRIEDLVVVESGGPRLLSHAPKDLVEIR